MCVYGTISGFRARFRLDSRQFDATAADAGAAAVPARYPNTAPAGGCIPAALDVMGGSGIICSCTTGESICRELPSRAGSARPRTTQLIDLLNTFNEGVQRCSGKSLILFFLWLVYLLTPDRWHRYHGLHPRSRMSARDPAITATPQM